MTPVLADWSGVKVVDRPVGVDNGFLVVVAHAVVFTDSQPLEAIVAQRHANPPLPGWLLESSVVVGRVRLARDGFGAVRRSKPLRNPGIGEAVTPR